MKQALRRKALALAGALIASGLAGALSPALARGGAAAAGQSAGLACDQSLKERFRPDAETQVLLVEKVARGAAFPNPTMEQMVYPGVPAVYGADLCHVKLLVGPPNPGPADAPSTSRGIGIEIWLPEPKAWNGRVHAVGGSGATGSQELALDRISEWTGGIDTRTAPRIAAEEGAVSSTTDSGRGADRDNGSWMYPDRTINFRALHDWSYRSLYEQAVKTRALARAYYGRAPHHAYFDGASGGGRQAYHIAQFLPEQYDGILAGIPAMAFAETMAHSWAGLVILRDLGGKTPLAGQLDLVSRSAIAACDKMDGQHLGFVIDNRACRYDPTRDAAVLCEADGGTNGTPDCITPAIAVAINKIWYGPTRDGSVPDPAIDNGWDKPLGGNRVWYGVVRGTDLKGWARIGSVLGMDALALVMGDPRFGQPSFRNASGNGEDAWKAMSYAEFARAVDRVRDAQPALEISANVEDLRKLRAVGTRLMSFTHLNDSVLPPQPVLAYYDHIMATMGGRAKVQRFFRQYAVPGLGHGVANGTPNPSANPPIAARGQLYGLLVEWVEKGAAPGTIPYSTANQEPIAIDPFPHAVRPAVSLPVCLYPAAPAYRGGDAFTASSYRCEG